MQYKVDCRQQLQQGLTEVEPARQNPSVQERAEGDLRFIRTIMQRTLRSLPLPGWGIAAVGVLGLFTAGIASFLAEGAWVTTWCLAAALSLALTLGTSYWQLENSSRSLLRDGFGKFWLSLVPAFGVAVLMTIALARAGLYGLLPGTWLMLYGLGILNASRYSVALVQWMAWVFLLLGAAALFTAWPNMFMALGFGLTHLVFGLLLARSDHE